MDRRTVEIPSPVLNNKQGSTLPVSGPNGVEILWANAQKNLTPQRKKELAEYRNYSETTVEWMVANGLVGWHQWWAFPNKTPSGRLVSIHFKTHAGMHREKDGWKHEPGGVNCYALDCGNPAARKIALFESQWDQFAFVDLIGPKQFEAEWRAIATRGNYGTKSLQGLGLYPGATFYLFTQNDAAGSVWEAKVLELLGCGSYVVDVPREHGKDLNDALRSGLSSVTLAEWIEKSSVHHFARSGYERVGGIGTGANGTGSGERSYTLPEIVSGQTMREVTLPLPDEVIAGLLSRGEKGELAGGSKSFKTWTLIQQGLSIAAGLPWWGFPTKKTNVLFLNLEIPQAFFEARVHTVANTLAIDIPDNFHVWHLRNAKLFEPGRWHNFLLELKQRASDIEHPFVTSDPIYKLLGGRNENAAGDVQQLLSQLDELIEVVDGANFFGHHFSKGNQSDKEAIDRAAGSGVFQRDPDSILTMTANEKEGCFSIDLILRNHEPVDPFVVQWSYPVFIRQGDVDPTHLKRAKNAQEKNIERKSDPTVLVHWLGDNVLPTAKLCKLVMNETGMTRRTFFRALEKALEQKLIVRDDVANVLKIPTQTS